MMKKWLCIFANVIFSCSALAQLEEDPQKKLKRYQDMKPLVEQMLRESGKIYYAMPQAMSQYQRGNADEWINVNIGLKHLNEQASRLGNDPLDPVYGSCVKMKNQLRGYWSGVIGDNEQLQERLKNQFERSRMDCFDSCVFGKEKIELKKDHSQYH
ncbi:hypothetical protein ABGM23_004811 [Escherichia albertii]